MGHDLDLPEITYPLVLDTIGKLIATEHGLTAHCGNPLCRHSAEIDLVAFARRFGVNCPCDHWHLHGRLRCSVCGQTTVDVTLNYRDTPRSSYG